MSRHPREKKNYGIGRASIAALIGVLVIAALGILLLNSLGDENAGTIGLTDYGIGTEAPPFAIPDVRSSLEGDANVDPEAACSVSVEGAITSCDFRGRPLIVSFWFTRGAGECVDVQDEFDRVAREFRDRAGFLSINVRDDRDRVEEIVAERAWQMQVGQDRDGAVANLYRVGGCPTFLFIGSDGVLERSDAGATDYAELRSAVRSFIDDRSK